MLVSLKLAVFALVALYTLGVSASALAYSASDIRLSVASFDGAQRMSRTFANQADVPAQPEKLSMEPDNVIKLAFQVALLNGEKAEKAENDYVPHQAWIVLNDPANDGARPFMWPLRVRKSSSSVSWSFVRSKSLSICLHSALIALMQLSRRH